MARCDYCKTEIGDGIHPYTLRLELFPAVEPSLTITAEDLERDFDAEIAAIVKALEQMSDEEALDQEKLMFVRHQFTLCPRCRHRIAGELERLLPPQEGT